MDRPIDRYRYPEHDIRFGKIRVNFDKVEVDLDENYYTANQVNKLFVKKEDAEKEHIKLIESITNVDIKTKDNKDSIDGLKESLEDYVLKEDDKSLIPNDKLSLIDENAGNIANLDTRVSINEENISSLIDSVDSINDSIDIINGAETTENSIRNIAKYYVDNTTHVSIKYVETLPETGETKYIYVTPSDKEGVYKQYIWNNKWIELDNTKIDLSGYYSKSEIDEQQAIQDTTISDVSDALTAWNREQDTEIEKRLKTSDFDTFKTAQKTKDETQDTNIKALSDYLTEEKQAEINEAISKAHEQNTDSKLVKGVQSVEVTETNIKLGHYAKDEDNLALVLGNGTSDSPHNAMSVDWNGNLKTSGNVTDGEGNILSKKVTLSDLAVNGRVTFLDNNGELITLTIEELRNLLMWVGTEAELDVLPDSEIVEGRIYSTFDGTIKRR